MRKPMLALPLAAALVFSACTKQKTETIPQQVHSNAAAVSVEQAHTDHWRYFSSGDNGSGESGSSSGEGDGENGGEGDGQGDWTSQYVKPNVGHACGSRSVTEDDREGERIEGETGVRGRAMADVEGARQDAEALVREAADGSNNIGNGAGDSWVKLLARMAPPRVNWQSVPVRMTLAPGNSSAPHCLMAFNSHTASPEL